MQFVIDLVMLLSLLYVIALADTFNNTNSRFTRPLKLVVVIILGLMFFLRR